MVGCTAICVFPEPEGQQADPQHLLADGLIHLSREWAGLRCQRLIEVLKHRGSVTLDGRHVFEITSNGITIRPRLEALMRGVVPHRRRRVRVSTGITGLDEMLHGGLLAGSTTALMGATGTGKTLLGLHALAAAAARGDPAVYYGTYESPDRVVARAESAGLPFVRYVKAGLIEVLWKAPLEHALDDFGYEIIQVVKRMKAGCLFVDGIDGLKQASFYPRRISGYLTALANELRTTGVTALFSSETTLFGADVRTPVEELSAIFENILLLRYVELRSHLYRLLSILKVRDSDYDTTIREFRVTGRGLLMSGSFESAERILGGHAHAVRPDIRIPDAEGGGVA